MKRPNILIGILIGALATISIYSFADKDELNKYAISQKQVEKFAKVYALTANYYVESVTDEKLVEGAINGMLTSLDPHSSYLSEKQFKELNEMTTGSFAGIGIEISRDKKHLGIKVIAPIDGTPAFIAGIKSGDLIIKIDNFSVQDMSLEDAVKKMRGRANTKVTLTIMRNKEIKPLKITLSRANIKIQSVKFALLSPNYAYVRVSSFQSDTVANLIQVLNDIKKQSFNLKGIVLDLRDNPGGILQSAIGVAGAFLPENDLIVYTKGRAPKASQQYFNTFNYYTKINNLQESLSNVPKIFKTLPMIVLVNQGSASASEIVAGAIQDYSRAKIIGTKTFGKGSVQNVVPLDNNTAIKLTTALYFTPKGRSIQADGIKPNIIVKSEYDEILSNLEFSEADLGSHINNPGTTTFDKKDNTPIITPPVQINTQKQLEQSYKDKILKMPKVVSKDIAVYDLSNDFQLKTALEILNGTKQLKK